jgi:lysophospholipase L1-like esterase
MATLAIQPGETTVFLGDSTTNGAATTSWWAGTGFFVDQVNAQIATDAPTPNKCTNASALCTNATAMATNSSQKKPPIVAINSGVNGDITGGIINTFAARVTAYAPRFVWLTIGINDLAGSTSNAAFAANYATILTMIGAISPTIKIACTYLHAHGEVWSTGPVWGVNVTGPGAITDAAIDAYNVQIANCVAACTNPCIAVDFRTALLAWEVTNNPSKLAQSTATQDGLHWTDVGRTAAATFALPYVVIG